MRCIVILFITCSYVACTIRVYSGDYKYSHRRPKLYYPQENLFNHGYMAQTMDRNYYNQNRLLNQRQTAFDEINRRQLRNREKIAALFRRPQYRPINSPNFRGRGGKRKYKTPILF